MASLGDLVVRVGGDVSGFSSAIHEGIDGLESFASIAEKSGAAFEAGFLIPLGAAAGILFTVGETFKTATNEIIRQTGAAGEQLDSLRESFSTVFVGVPESAKEVASALGEIATRLDLKGEPLEALTTQIINLARVTGEDLGPLVTDVSRLFQKWQITTEDQAGALDLLLGISQKTGVGVGKLSSLLTEFDDSLQAVGIGFNQAATLIGKLEKAGVQIEPVLNSIQRGLLKMGKEGVQDPVQGLQQIIEKIHNATTEGQAFGIGAEAFGRGAVEIVGAVRAGKLSLEDFNAIAEKTGSTVNDQAEQMKTFGQRLSEVNHQIAAALEPLGTGFIEILDGAVGALTPLLNTLGGGVHIVTQFAGEVRDLAVAIGQLGFAQDQNKTQASPEANIGTYAQLGVAAAQVAIKALTDEVKSLGGAVPGMQADFQKAMGSIAQGIPTLDSATRSALGLSEAHRAISAAANDLQAKQTAANEALKIAQGVLAEIKTRAAAGAADIEDVARAQKNVEAATKAANPALNDSSKALKELKPEVDALTFALGVLNKEYSEARTQVSEAKAALQEGRATVEDVATAENHLKDVMTALHPTWAQHAADLVAATAAMVENGTWADNLSGSLDELGKRVQETVKPEAIADLKNWGKELADLKLPVDALTAAYRELGLRGGDPVEAARKAEEAFEIIKASGRDAGAAFEILMQKQLQAAESVGDFDLAGKIRQQMEEYRREVQHQEAMATTEISAAEQIKWAQWDQQEKDHFKNSIDRWAQFYRDIHSGLEKFQSDTINVLVTDFFHGNPQNDALDKQAESLKASLAQQTASYQNFVNATEDQIAALPAKYQASLDKELGSLQDSLAKQQADYDKFFADKTEAYDRSVADIQEKISRVTEANAEDLAHDLDQLKQQLADKTEAYAEYVQDVNTKLQRIGQNTAQDIKDRTTQEQRSIADKQKDYDRAAEDTQAKIDALTKANAKGNAQQIADLKLALQRKKEDLDTYTARAVEDLKTYTDEHNAQAKQQTDDLRLQLQRQTDDYNQYVQQNAAQAAQVTSAHQEQLTQQLADLHTQLDRETADYNEAIAEKKQALDQFTADNLAAQAQAVIDNQAKMAQDTANLQKSLEDKKAAYDQYVADNKKQLDAILAQHVSTWKEITNLLTGKGGVFDKITESFLSAVVSPITDGLFRGLSEVFTKIAAHIGDWLDPIIGKATSTLAGIATPPFSTTSGIPGLGGGSGGTGIPGGPGGEPGIDTGAGSAASSIGSAGVSSIVSAVTGVISAVTGIIGVFQNAHQETTLNAIELSTRVSAFYLGGDNSGGGILHQVYLTNELLSWGPIVKAVEAIRDELAGGAIGRSSVGLDGTALALLDDIKQAVLFGPATKDLDDIKALLTNGIKVLGFTGSDNGPGSAPPSTEPPSTTPGVPSAPGGSRTDTQQNPGADMSWWNLFGDPRSGSGFDSGMVIMPPTITAQPVPPPPHAEYNAQAVPMRGDVYIDGGRLWGAYVQWGEDRGLVVPQS